MSIRRLNAVNGKYTEIKIPKSWKIASSKTIDPEKKIQCIHCSQTIKFGDSYESKRYLNKDNVGYRECKECYNNFLPLYNSINTF
jgi:hypothetical protein